MRKRKILVIFFVTFWVGLTSMGLYMYQTLKTANILVGKEQPVPLFIPNGATFKTVQDSLHKNQYVENLVSFSFLAKILKYNENVKPGKYLLQPNSSNLETIRYLRSGNQSPVKVTFNNIRLKEELAEKITANLQIDSNDFLTELSDPDVFQSYGFDTENFMSMFLPNTYEVYWNTTVEKLMKRMNDEYSRFWNKERMEKAQSIGLSPVEVSILASIVYAESYKKDEIPKIAGLYLNRLKRNIPLQADPTLIFAAKDFTIKRVLNKHKEINSPYNTYKYTGLPPGPINLPPITAIDGVLNFESHNYLYMCAREDFSGYHNFAKTYNEHLRNARKYQNELNKAKLFR